MLLNYFGLCAENFFKTTLSLSNMDKDTLLKALAGTLDASNFQLRKESEQKLHVFEQQPGFTAYLLDLCVDDNVPPGIQISAIILFKNRINHYWIVDNDKSVSSIKDNEKAVIKTKLIQTLIKCNKNTKLRSQLATAINHIVNLEKWTELIDIIKKLLTSGDADQINSGLICLYQYSKAYRWSHLEGANSSNPILNDICNEIFPILENLMDNLLNNDSDLSDEMLYLIVKIFKFTTFSSLPSYLQDTNNLGKWCKYQIMIINKPLPESVMKESIPEERNTNPRVKTVKWCFGNLHRFLSRHGGGFATRDKASNSFAHKFLTTFVPEILKVYWQIIENWSTKKIWLSEGSLYHMISFLEQLIENDAWGLISVELEAILRHVILPTLSATDETIELYEDDPEEYYRRYFDISRENNNSDVASIGFIYRLCSRKFEESSSLMFNIINEIFDKRSKDRQDLEIAKSVEGAFRILSTISYMLDKKSSPVHDQVDQLLYVYVYPELSVDTANRTPFLTARACDTVAMFIYIYQDQKVLQDIFTEVVNCFQRQDQLPIRLTAIDALRTLVDNDAVAEHIAPQVPQLMGTLIEMSKTIESDTLTSIMESFVEKFAYNLEPYAIDLSTKLSAQFLKLAHELLELQTSDPNGDGSGTSDIDKEYRASGILNTIATLVVAMSSSPFVASSLEPVFQDLVAFVLHNAQVAFLLETLEILESLIVTNRHVSPIIWESYQIVIGCFDTYAEEFFDSFESFFNAIVCYGFANEPEVTIENKNVQALVTVCFNILKSDNLDPIFAHSAFEILEIIITGLGKRFKLFLPVFLSEIYNIFIQLKQQDAFDGYMLHDLSIIRIFFSTIIIDPVTSLQFLNDKGFTQNFFKLWIQFSSDFQSVYGCKLQILTGLSLVCDGGFNLINDKDLIGEIVDLLVSNLEALPIAIKAKQELANAEYSKQLTGDEEGDDYDKELDVDDAELEAMKITPIDDINVFESFVTQITRLQQQNSSSYQEFVSRLDADQQNIVNQVFQTYEKLHAD